jgi:hypothetical protein
MAFISNSKKFVFVHLHKCGGTSIERALDEEMQWNDIVLGSTEYGEKIQKLYQNRFGPYKHSSALEIKKLIGNPLWEEYFTFSIVRHPIDRIVSFYEYLKTYYLGGYRGSAIKLMYALDQVGSIPPALTQLPKLYDSFRWPGVVACLTSRTISEFIHSEKCWQSYGTMPQFEQLADEAGEHLIVNHVGRLEDIGKDWEHICNKIGISTSLPHSNKSKRRYRDWREYFSLDDLNYLEIKYRKDIDTFGYEI